MINDNFFNFYDTIDIRKYTLPCFLISLLILLILMYMKLVSLFRVGGGLQHPWQRLGADAVHQFPPSN